MISISHVELQNCLDDPEAWVSRLINQTTRIRLIGYAQVLRDTIMVFHKAHDYEATEKYLEGRLSRRKFKDVGRVQAMREDLNSYQDWYERYKPSVAVLRHRIAFDLGSSVVLGGTISRIDVTNTGYRGILLDRIPNDWQTQLRMPLIQRALARGLSRDEKLFEVGFQQLDGQELQSMCYDSSHIDKVERHVRQQVAGISVEFNRQSMNTS